MSVHIPYLELRKKYDALNKELDETRRTLKTKTRSEMKYRMMAESSSLHLITIDFSGNVIASNKPLNEINPEELAGDSIYSYIHSSSMDALKKCFEIVRKSGKKARLKTIFIGHNNKFKKYDVQISPVFISNIVAALCLSMTLCPKKKKSPEQLIFDVDNFWSILERTNHGLLFLLPDGTFTKANTAALEMIGCGLDQLIGKKIPELDWEVVDVENPSLCGCQQQSTDFSTSHPFDRPSMGNGNATIRFYNPRRKNTIRLIIHAVGNHDDGHACNICILQDITQQDQITEKYEQLFTDYQNALDKLNILN
jgi:PAS domain-containing protein